MVFWVAHGFSVPKCSYLKTFGTQRVSSINSFASRKLRSRGSTGRSALMPSGNQSFESVKSGNLIANRTLCLLWVAAALQCWWILEQPKNSLMQDLPAFQAFMKHVTTYRHHIRMQDYGAPTEKGTWLYSGFLPSTSNLLVYALME